MGGMREHVRASWKQLGPERWGEALFQMWLVKKGLGGLPWQAEGWGRALARKIVWLLESPSCGCRSTLLPNLLSLTPSMQLVTVPEVDFL